MISEYPIHTVVAILYTPADTRIFFQSNPCNLLRAHSFPCLAYQMVCATSLPPHCWFQHNHVIKLSYKLRIWGVFQPGINKYGKYPIVYLPCNIHEYCGILFSAETQIKVRYIFNIKKPAFLIQPLQTGKYRDHNTVMFACPMMYCRVLGFIPLFAMFVQ